MVNTSDNSQADNETIAAFKELQETLGTVGEVGLLTLLRALETVAGTVEDVTGAVADNLSE